MSIKFKAVIIIIISVLFAAIGQYILSNIFFMNNVILQEKAAVNMESKRAQLLIKQYLSNIETLVGDWAPWDDTLEFVNNMNEDYINSNLSIETLNNLEISTAVFLDKYQNVKFSLEYDAETQNPRQISDSLKSAIEKNKKMLCSFKDLYSRNSSILNVNGKAIFIATGPITDSAYETPESGVLAFVKQVDDEVIGKIGEITGSSIEITDIDGIVDSIDIAALKEFKMDKPDGEINELVIPADDEYVIGYSQLKDISGNALFLVKITIEREIYKNGKNSMFFFELMVFSMILILTSVCIVLLQKKIWAPIIELSNGIKNINLENMSFNKPILAGKDEISKLSEEINRMLVKIEKTNKKMLEGEHHDKLTGLYNRGYFDYLLDKRLEQRELPFSIIIGDINGLKTANDTYGHHIGDEILVAVAGILKSCCRSEDIISRWGGDEFAIILNDASDRISEEVCQTVKRKCIENKTELLPLNISMGYSTMDNVKQDITQIIREAEERMNRNKLFSIKSSRYSIIASLLKTLSEKSHETEEHTGRIYEKCERIGNRLNMSNVMIDELLLLAVLHDIGKIAIPDYILNKPDKLNAEEWKIMMSHTEIGYRIASATIELSHIAYPILTHHEYYNGKGYPKGLSGDEIPLISRIVAIVDAFDVMTNFRPYREAITFKKAINELKRCSGTQFDPGLTELCIEVFNEDIKAKAG